MARLRTFIAVHLDPGVHARCTALQQKLGRNAVDVKWVEPDNVHLTLLFLGEVDERALVGVCRAAADVCASLDAFEITVEGVGCFPNLKRPRVVWAGVTRGAERMVALHDALEEPLLELGCYRREDRKYTPHVTLGRVKSERPSDHLARAVEQQAGWRAGESPVNAVHVMSSELRPQGPVYSVLSTAPLRQPGA